MEIAAFDIVETGEYLDNLLAIAPKEHENVRFATLGLQSVYLVNNMGTMFFAYVVWVLLAIFALLINKYRKVS